MAVAEEDVVLDGMAVGEEEADAEGDVEAELVLLGITV